MKVLEIVQDIFPDWIFKQNQDDSGDPNTVHNGSRTWWNVAKNIMEAELSWNSRDINDPFCVKRMFEFF